MQNQFKGTIFTNHALQRLSQRRITQSDAWYTLRRPDKSLKGKTPGSWKFYKDYGSQRIEVVAKKNEKGTWVVLSCWSKQMGTDQPLFSHQKSSHQGNLLEKIIDTGLKKLGKWIQKKKTSKKSTS